MAESRKEREVVLSDYRKQADEKKEFAEKVERRVRPLLLHKTAMIVLSFLQLRRASTTHSIAQCKYLCCNNTVLWERLLLCVAK